jgi:8-oxo-dGTP pyrophosphatase MutT (NUDIX family)
MNWSGVLGTPVKPLESGTPKVMDLPAFDGYADPKKLDVISRIAEQAGRDPQLATVAVNIFRQYKVLPRDYRGQAAALLRWVQENIYYVNEPDERLQDPFYTLKVKYGDCDDLAILVYALARSVRLPAKLVISGTTKNGRKVRYHHGDRNFDRRVDWSHIYLMIGDRPYGEPKWSYAEPTLNVPLGWDVVSHSGNILPEMSKTPSYGSAMSSLPMSVPILPESSVVPKRFTPSMPSLSPSLSPRMSPLLDLPRFPGLPPMRSEESDMVEPRLRAPGVRYGGDPDGSANAVAILLVDRGGQILLLHRAPQMEFMGGSWDLPGAKVNPSLSAREQAARVLTEETGIRLPVAALRTLLTAYHPNAGTVMFFVADVTGEVARSVMVNAPEHTEFRWVGLREGADMAVVPYMPLVLEALRRSREPVRQYGQAAETGGEAGYGVGALALAAVAGFVVCKLMK